METEIIIFGIPFIIIVSVVIYTKTKKFRERQEQKLINSTEFQDLLRLGFKRKKVGQKIIYSGVNNEYQFVIFIDPDDVMARNGFSLVFSVTYSKIEMEKLKQLNNEYYNRLKSLLVNSENIFFNWDYAQFRYPNSKFKISSNNIKSRLNQISEILKNEKLIPRNINDYKTVIARDYE